MAVTSPIIFVDKINKSIVGVNIKPFCLALTESHQTDFNSEFTDIITIWPLVCYSCETIITIICANIFFPWQVNKEVIFYHQCWSRCGVASFCKVKFLHSSIWLCPCYKLTAELIEILHTHTHTKEKKKTYT